METQLEDHESKKNAEQRSIRNVDRTVKDLQSQIERRDKANSQLNDNIAKSREKIERLLHTIDDLQSSDSEYQLQARRAERELREAREKSLLLEKELDSWKASRMERGSGVGRVGGIAGLSDIGEYPVGDGSRRGSGAYSATHVRQRKPSNTKGFL